MYFFIEVDELLETYNDICNEVSNSIEKKLDCEFIYNKKILKTKTRSYGHENTDFQDKEIPKVDSNYVCVAVILINFVFKKDGKYYPQVL